MVKDKHGNDLKPGDVVDHESGGEMGVVVKVGPPYGGDDPDEGSVTVRRYRNGREWAFPSRRLERIRT